MTHILKKTENIELDSDKKRKRDEKSSVSDLDSSGSNTPITLRKKDRKSKPAKPKKVKGIESIEESTINMEDISQQLLDINKKLAKVITKDDDDLKDLIKTVFTQMKEELLKSVFHRIELLESKLFEKDQENDELKMKVKTLEQKNQEQKSDNTRMTKTITDIERKTQEKLNDMEQYGRRNNIRINGIDEINEYESTEQTTSAVTKTLNSKINGLNLKHEDIDISHRLAKKKNGKRQIIVKFVSRMTREKVLKNKKEFKGTGIFINEDLTAINQHVLACLKKKMPDEVDSVWTREGRLFYKNKVGNKHEIKYGEYQKWVDLPWPAA